MDSEQMDASQTRGNGDGRVFTDRLNRLRMPELVPVIGSSLADAEQHLASLAIGDDITDLTHADVTRFPPPDWFIEEFVRSVEQRVEAFTPCRGDPDALAAVAPGISRFLGIEVDPQRNLAFTPGTQGALFCVMAALVQEGDTVLLANPDYLSNERLVRYLGASVSHVDLSLTANRAEIDLEQLEEGLRAGARIVMFSNPSNPTGAVHEDSTLRRIAELVLNYEAFVLVDELYARLCYNADSVQHLVALPGMLERCITTLGPSKLESASGFRIGCVVAPAAVIDGVDTILDITAIRASAYAQHALRSWLTEDEEFVRRRVAEYRRLRDITVSRLRELEFLEVFEPSGTGYLFPDASRVGVDSVTVAKTLLGRARIRVNPGISFGPGGSGSFRMCFAQDERTWPKVLDRMSGVLEEMAERTRS